jgi:hypothetical protein
LNFLKRTGRKISAKRELIIIEIKIKRPKLCIGGKLEKKRTKNPVPTTRVLNMITVPLFLTVCIRASIGLL